MAVRQITIPGQNVPIQIGNVVNPDWYEKFKFLELLNPLSDIPGPTLPSPVTPGSSSSSVSTAALTNTGVPPGVPANTINFGATPSVAQQQANWATVVVYFGDVRTDLQSSQSAISSLDSRVSALESAINSLIAGLS